MRPNAAIDLTNWRSPTYSAAGAIKTTELSRVDTPIVPVEIPDPYQDWLQCLRRRATTNAPIEAGYYYNSVQVNMGTLGMDTGKRRIFDPHRLWIYGIARFQG